MALPHTEAMPPDAFKPPCLLKNAHLQTFLASFKIRAFGKNPMVLSARRSILTLAGGVRLLGMDAPQRRRPPKGLVVMIHGWEGSVDSTYMRTTGRLLYNNGFHVFRLNLRDHGDSLHLNAGLFYATRLDEVYQAVKSVAGRAGQGPVFLVGFSLGGNFALRVARHCATEGIDNLCHVVSVSPVLDPDKATDRIDGDRWIRGYFLKKWRTSLAEKQALFPRHYDFSPALGYRSIRRITDFLISEYSTFKTSRAYFQGYSLLGDALTQIRVPTTIIAAADDPVIPVEDFHRLQLSRCTRLVVHRHGGHQGFVENLSMSCWHERKILALFDKLAASGKTGAGGSPASVL